MPYQLRYTGFLITEMSITIRDNSAFYSHIEQEILVIANGDYFNLFW